MGLVFRRAHFYPDTTGPIAICAHCKSERRITTSYRLEAGAWMPVALELYRPHGAKFWTTQRQHCRVRLPHRQRRRAA